MFEQMKNARIMCAAQRNECYISLWPCAGLTPRGSTQTPAEWLRQQPLEILFLMNLDPSRGLNEPWGRRDVAGFLNPHAVWAFVSGDESSLVGNRIDIGHRNTLVCGVPIVGIIPPEALHIQKKSILMLSDGCAKSLGFQALALTQVFVRPSEKDTMQVLQGLEAVGAAFPETEDCEYICTDPSDGSLFNEWGFPHIDGEKTPAEWLEKQSLDTLRFMDLFYGLDEPWGNRGIGALLNQRIPWAIAARNLGLGTNAAVTLFSQTSGPVTVLVIGVVDDALYGARTFVLSRSVAKNLQISQDYLTIGRFMRLS